MTTHTGAKDETYGVFLTELQLSAGAIVGYVPEVRWHGVEEQGKPDKAKFYIRANFETMDSKQMAFADCSEPGSTRIWQSEGLATFSIYSPKIVADADRKADLLAEELRNAFRAPRLNSEVWFRNQRIHPTYPEDQFQRTTLTVEFYFTEVA